MSGIGRGLEPPRDGIKEEADPGRSATLPGSFRQVSVSRTVAPCRRHHLPIPFPQRRVQCSSFVGTRNGHKRRAGFRVTSAPPFRVSPNRQMGVVERTPIQAPPPPSSHPLHLELRGFPPAGFTPSLPGWQIHSQIVQVHLQIAPPAVSYTARGNKVSDATALKP